MNILKDFNRIWTFYAKAQTKYEIHSPFISDLIQQLNKPLSGADHTLISDIESTRKELLGDRRKIKLDPMGAGSRLKEQNEIEVKQLASRSLSTKRQCLTYFKLIKWLRPRTMLELGTSLGISTLYQHVAAPDAQFISIEGRPSVHHVAREIILKNKKSENIQLKLGLFEDHLDQILNAVKQIDYVFIDGDHQGESLVRYLQKIIPYTHPDTVMVLHDIYWSDNMLEAWHEIIEWPQIKASIDTYEMGILIFNHAIIHKQNISLISPWLKPWRQGFLS